MPKIDAPVNLSINYDDSLVTLQWDSISGADKYYIYGKNNPYDGHVLLDSTSLTSWTDIMGSNPASGYGVGDTYPVYLVSWYAILVYCNLRSMAEGITPCYTISGSTDPADWGEVPTNTNSTWNSVTCNWSANGYRLPSEAEWEYAARGGIHNADNYHYSGGDTIDDVAWYDGNNDPYGSKPVGTKAPNQLGLYDMSGNLWEWSWDWYGSYTSDSVTNPYGPTTGSYRVLRGGRWYDYARGCRVASRYSVYPYYSYLGLGLPAFEDALMHTGTYLRGWGGSYLLSFLPFYLLS